MRRVWRPAKHSHMDALLSRGPGSKGKVMQILDKKYLMKPIARPLALARRKTMDETEAALAPWIQQ